MISANAHLWVRHNEVAGSNPVRSSVNKKSSAFTEGSVVVHLRLWVIDSLRNERSMIDEILV